ncbi:hypothetical protein DFH28DRAFT_1085940 [Melampsora americana]|nr:hypothetical protein DFH28DRAFT_1085940 [Melampsora americana]
MAHISVQAHTPKKHLTSVPLHILAEAKALQEIYIHRKASLSLMGNWLRYIKERRLHNMPAGGQTGILGGRNKCLGEIWTTLPCDHWKVFHPPVFYSLSRLSHSTLEGSDDQDEDPFLEPEERGHLQTLYDQLVCKERVAQDYAKVAASSPDGPTLPDYNQKSKNNLECIHTQLHNESNNMDFAYYHLACSTHAATESSSSSPRWCKEFTSHDEMALYVNKKSNFGTVFSTQVKGLSIAEAVSATIGGSTMVESKLTRYKHGFPRGPDPESILENKYLLKIIQLPGLKLTKEVLKLGFNGMNTYVKANLFKMVKLSSSNSNSENEDDDESDHSDTDQEDLQNIQQSEEAMGSEDKWNGLGDDFDQ